MCFRKKENVSCAERWAALPGESLESGGQSGGSGGNSGEKFPWSELGSASAVRVLRRRGCIGGGAG